MTMEVRMAEESAIAELLFERQTQRNLLNSLETKRGRTSLPLKQAVLDAEIRTQAQHLLDIETVLAVLRLSQTR
jgi:hypothetical protein